MKTKKIVALLLTLAVTIASFSLLGVSVSAVDVQNQIEIVLPEENDNTYTLNGITYTVIDSVEEMNEYAAVGGTHYILNADLDYTGVEYKRINLTNGSLNGNGHSITGVNLEEDTKDVSMFSNATNGSTISISNLTIGSPTEYVSVATTENAAGDASGNARVGTLFGFVQAKITIENVTVYSDVTTAANYRTGGFIGEGRDTVTLKNCVFNGDVTVAVGSKTTKLAAGGLIGYGSKGTIVMENCATYGSVSHPNGYAGGLYGGAERYTTYTNCANYATVSGKWSGGLIGDAGENLYTRVTMDNCFNAGKVIGTESAAGLINRTVRRADGYGATLTNCANLGEVDAANKADLVYSVGTDTSKGENINQLIIANCGSFGTEFALVNKEASNINIAGDSTPVDAAAALKFMQDNFGFAMFGIEAGKIVVKTVPAEAKFIQYAKDAEAGKMDIRVIGVLNTAELENYANIGFKVSVYKTGESEALGSFTKTTTTVYESISANEGGTITEYSATDLGATYLYALELKNISMSGSYTFEITAFATEATGSETIDDITVTFSVVDGAIK